MHFKVSETFPSGLFLFLVRAAVMMLCGFLFILSVMTQTTEGALLVISQNDCAQRLKFSLVLDSILCFQGEGGFTSMCKMFLLSIKTEPGHRPECLKRPCVCVCEQTAATSVLTHFTHRLGSLPNIPCK